MKQHKKKEVWLIKEVNPIVKLHKNKTKKFWSNQKLSHM
jgi:hypothetical protein